MTILVLLFSLSRALLYISFLLALLYFTIQHLLYSRYVKRWRQANLPFLPPTFLIGHKYFSELKGQSLLAPLDRIYRENNDKELVAFFMVTVPVVLLRDPKLIQKVFAKSSDKALLSGLSAAAINEETKNMIISAPDKASWKFSRATLAPVFSSSMMGSSEFSKVLKRIKVLWRYSEEARLSGRPLDVRSASRNFVMDGILHWYFGEDNNSYETIHPIDDIVSEFFRPTLFRTLTFFVLLQWPCLQVFQKLRLMPQTQINAMASFLKQKLDYRDTHKINENDFIGFLGSLRNGSALKKSFKDQDDDSVKSYDGINMKQMTGFGLVVTLAGTDTVSGLVSFAIHLLSLHPEHQERVRKETDAAMKRHKVTEFTIEVVQDLHFTEQCLLETARLYPLLSVITRIISEDFQIPGTKYTLKKGDRVIMTPYSVHHDPRYFKDPDKFDPERFSPENRAAMPPESYLGFGIGPRKCPGYKLGLAVAATFIASLLHKYELRPRSHLRQMDVTDFHPHGIILQNQTDLLVDLIHR